MFRAMQLAAATALEAEADWYDGNNRNYRNREVFELPAKLFQVKFTYTLETVAHCHLIVILQMLCLLYTSRCV